MLAYSSINRWQVNITDISQIFDIFNINCSYIHDSLFRLLQIFARAEKGCECPNADTGTKVCKSSCLQAIGNWPNVIHAKEMLSIIFQQSNNISTTALHRTTMIMTMLLLTSWSPRCDLMARISNINQWYQWFLPEWNVGWWLLNIIHKLLPCNF